MQVKHFDLFVCAKLVVPLYPHLCRPTTVHRFIVRGTVEEKLYALLHGTDSEDRQQSALQVTLE